MKLKVGQGDALEGQKWVLLGLAVGNDQLSLTQSGVINWKMRVYRSGGSTSNTAIFTLDAQPSSSIIFDALQNDYGWTGPEGYNFRLVFNPNVMAEPEQGGQTYLAEIILNTVLWGDVPLIYEVRVRSLRST